MIFKGSNLWAFFLILKTYQQAFASQINNKYRGELHSLIEAPTFLHSWSEQPGPEKQTGSKYSRKYN